MPHLRLCGAVVLATLAPLAGCSGGDDDDATASSQSPPAPTAAGTPNSARTTATSSTTVESSTTSSSTTTPPTTTMPTTTIPPTTVDEVQATKAAIVAAVVQTREAYNYAVTNYGAPDVLDVLARSAIRDSPSWNLVVQNMDTLRANGWLVRPHPEIPDTSTVEGEVQLLDGPPATRAEATVCTISAGVVYKPGAAPDGADDAGAAGGDRRGGSTGMALRPS